MGTNSSEKLAMIGSALAALGNEVLILDPELTWSPFPTRRPLWLRPRGHAVRSVFDGSMLLIIGGSPSTLNDTSGAGDVDDVDDT